MVPYPPIGTASSAGHLPIPLMQAPLGRMCSAADRGGPSFATPAGTTQRAITRMILEFTEYSRAGRCRRPGPTTRRACNSPAVPPEQASRAGNRILGVASR